MSSPLSVSILMGSKTDAETMSRTEAVLEQFGVPFDTRVLSAHRTPDETVAWVKGAEERGVGVFIAAAGLAAHLAGVVAANTTLPVLGVPMAGGSLQGFDALLSTVQMPKGTPVGTLAVGSAGATNAALLAVRILALRDESLKQKLVDYKKQLAEEILKG